MCGVLTVQSALSKNSILLGSTSNPTPEAWLSKLGGGGSYTATHRRAAGSSEHA